MNEIGVVCYKKLLEPFCCKKSCLNCDEGLKISKFEHDRLKFIFHSNLKNQHKEFSKRSFHLILIKTGIQLKGG